MVRNAPDYAAPTGLATQLAGVPTDVPHVERGKAPLEHASPSPYVKEHARCLPRPATVNVAYIGHTTICAVKAIVSDYRNRT